MSAYIQIYLLAYIYTHIDVYVYHLEITRAIPTHARAVTRAVDSKLWHESRAVRHVATIHTSPLGIACAIAEPTNSVTTAIAGAGVGPRAINAVPAQIAGARAVEARPMI